MRVLGINAIFHDPAAALVVNGRIVAAAEEDKHFSRRRRGKRTVPFSAWELPVRSARWCLSYAGLNPADLDAVDLDALAPKRDEHDEMTEAHADLASSVQIRVEEVIVDLARWLYNASSGPYALAMAGGVALNCVANACLSTEGPYCNLRIQPAAGGAGTALRIARRHSGTTAPMPGPNLGRGYTDFDLGAELCRAGLPYTRPDTIAELTARVFADHGIVAWFQGHRSPLAHPGKEANTERLNDVKGREIFEGELPSPYMLFVRRVRDAWRKPIPAEDAPRELLALGPFAVQRSGLADAVA